LTQKVSRRSRHLSVILLGAVRCLLVSEGIDIGIRDDFLIVLGARIVFSFEESFPVVFGEPIESGFGMFIHGADSGHQTGVEESFHPFAELIGRTLGGASYFGFECQTPRFAGRTAFRIE
jgi:hypothetical protein